MKLLTYMLAVMALASACRAAVWSVAVDGSGDYSVIQDAVDAAADGDTISLGPGRYDSYRRYTIGVWVDRVIYVYLDSRSLTFVGSGEGEAIVGPVVPHDQSEGEIGIALVNGSSVAMSSLVVEGLDMGVYTWSDSYIEVVDCTFRDHSVGHAIGLYSAAGAHLESCLFQGYDSGVAPGVGSENVTIRGCIFEAVGVGITTNNSIDISIEDCHISATALGVMVWSGTTGVISNSWIAGQGSGLVVENGSQMNLYNTILTGGSLAGMEVNGRSSLLGVGNIIQGGDFATIRLNRSGIILADSHVLRSSGRAVLCQYSIPGEEWNVDLKNNWWGTSEADSIASMIWDSSDDSAVHATVQYVPFLDHPVGSEEKSVSDLKGMFR